MRSKHFLRAVVACVAVLIFGIMSPYFAEAVVVSTSSPNSPNSFIPDTFQGRILFGPKEENILYGYIFQ